MLVGCSIVHYIIIQQEMLRVSEQKEVSISSKVSGVKLLARNACVLTREVSSFHGCP